MKTNKDGKPKRGPGRPRVYTDHAPVYVNLRDDLRAYARRKAAQEGRTFSNALAHLIEQGVALEVVKQTQRAAEGSP